MITFNPTEASAVYRWFNLIPKGSGPEPVRRMLSRLDCTEADTILDPFSGEGTTLVECQFAGLRACGVEINPFLHFVGSALTDWGLDPEEADRYSSVTMSCFESSKEKIAFADLEEAGLPLPAIDRPLKWWREDVITDLLLLKKAIHSEIPAPAYRRFFLLALAGVLVPDLTNVRIEDHQLYLINRDEDRIDVGGTFSAHLRRMIGDLRRLRRSAPRHDARHVLGDATRLDNLPQGREITRVVTSPPYCDRYSFTWNTLPHLHFFDFLGDAKASSGLDEAALGGTWGSATFKLMRGEIAPLNRVVAETIRPILRQLPEGDRLSANFITKYFNLLAAHILALEKVPQRRLQVAYLIGDTRVGEVRIEAGAALAAMLEKLDLGYRVQDIEGLGPYGGDEDLCESIVYASK